MFKKIADNRDEKSLAVQFRRKRFAFFNSLLSRLRRPVSLLDVGGAESYWKTMGMNGDDQVFITLLNLTKENVTLPNITSTVGDAREIQYEDNSFDVVFSNSVIEHVGSRADQMQMANEVRRVGKRYFVQTPNRYFPLEPHFLECARVVFTPSSSLHMQQRIWSYQRPFPHRDWTRGIAQETHVDQVSECFPRFLALRRLQAFVETSPG